MSGVDPGPDASDEAVGGEPFDERLVSLYRDYLGEPERELDVYLGFGLFFGGLAMGIVGLVLFAVEKGISAETVFWLREIAFAVGALGLPTLLFGVTVLLPVDRRATYAALAGLVVTLVALAFFVSVYPYYWDAGSTNSLRGVALYAVGLVTVVGATAAALVSYHVERVSGVPDVEPDTEEPDEDPETVAERARRDVDEALAEADVSWGGVEKQDVSRRLDVQVEEDIDRSEFDRIGGTERVAGGDAVDEAVSGLQQLRGGAERTDTGSGTDDQAAALRELREQKRAEEAASAGDRGVTARARGWLARLKRWLGLA